jgi:hypothetical protein
MGAPNMQLPSHTGTEFRKVRKFIKRATAKKVRREGKLRGENLTPRIQGYVD